MSDVRYDAAVVGLGPMGAGALRRLAKDGLRCVGVGSPEPAALAGHEGVFASHYDSGRITRHLDASFEWAELARRAIADYAAIEEEGGELFHRPVGLRYAVADPRELDAIHGVLARLGDAGRGVRELDVCDDPRVVLPDGATVLAEARPAGHIDPRRMVRALLTAAQRAGATVVRDEVVAVSADGSGGGWSLRLTGGGTVAAERLLVAAGPHTDELEGLPVRPWLDVRAEAIVMGVPDDEEQDRLDGLPSLIAALAHPVYEDCYLVPPTDYPDGTVRVKLGATRRVHQELPDAAARRAWMRGTEHTIELGDLRGLVEAVLPGVRATAWETRPCLITETPTHRPYVAEVAPGLVLAAGGNGYAAKSGLAIGALAATLLREGRWTDAVLDADRFRVVTR